MNEELTMTYRTQVLNEEGQILADCRHAFDANTYYCNFCELYRDFPTFTIRQYADCKDELFMRETHLNGIGNHGFVKVNE